LFFTQSGREDWVSESYKTRDVNGYSYKVEIGTCHMTPGITSVHNFVKYLVVVYLNLQIPKRASFLH